MTELNTDIEHQDLIRIEPIKIKVKDGLTRFRKEMGDVADLAKSIKDKGQILPIVINRNYELIDGGRRLAACLLANVKVLCIFSDRVDPIKMREWELEANLHRKAFTPAEDALAVAELHALKVAQHGETQPGMAGGHSQAATAKLLGRTQSSVAADLELAAMVEAFPELRSAKTKSEIKRAASGAQKAMGVLINLQQHKDAITSGGGKATFTLIKGDALLHMCSVPDNSVNILLTDPLYGINADQIGITTGGHTGGALSSCGYTVADGVEPALFYLAALAKESFRFTKEDAHGYVFVGPEHFHAVSDLFSKQGWRVHVKPIIWIKRTTGQCNVPCSWPSSAYEMLLYIRKDASCLTQKGKPDWIECPPIMGTNKLHPYEKPVPLLNNLLARVSLPGQNVYDPFMGSGATIEAAYNNKLFATGVDIDTTAHAFATARMARVVAASEVKS